MLAVATIIENRVNSPLYANDYISVCTQPNQFDGYARGKKIYESGQCDPIMWDKAMEIAESMVSDNFVISPSLDSEYLYMHSEKYGNKDTIARIKSKPETRILGGNMFYKTWP